MIGKGNFLSGHMFQVFSSKSLLVFRSGSYCQPHSCFLLGGACRAHPTVMLHSLALAPLSQNAGLNIVT